MTPKPKKTRESTKTTYSMEEMQSEMNSKLSALIEKFELLEASLVSVTREKEALKVTVAEQANELAELRNSLNEREQYARSWSMRILNIPVHKDNESDTRHVMQAVYDHLIQPILEGVRANGDIDNVPDCDALLETAHILPGKGDGPKPVMLGSILDTGGTWCSGIARTLRPGSPAQPPPLPPTPGTGSRGPPECGSPSSRT